MYDSVNYLSYISTIPKLYPKYPYWLVVAIGSVNPFPTLIPFIVIGTLGATKFAFWYKIWEQITGIYFPA